MKDIFPGYSKKSKEELKELWNNSLITFDANVLLDLYRYSKKTRQEIIHLISKFGERVFLTHQAAFEYNKRRYEVISDQEKSYYSFLDQINTIESLLSDKSTPPFLSERLHDSIIQVFENVKSEVNTSVDSFNQMGQKDDIFESLSEIFKERITESYSSEKLEEIYKEGEIRYKKEIPPGYKDIKKNGNSKYGDLILWKQILDKANSSEKSIIFITNEQKEDWLWQLKNKKIVGPRQELVEEMKSINNLDFHIYNSKKFFQYGQDHLEEQINEDALKEIATLKNSEEDYVEKLVNESERILKLKKDYLESQLELLTPAQADVIRLNWGLGLQEPMSINEIADIFDSSTERISGLKERGLKALISNLTSKKN